jgi:hypothetical protein
LVTFDPAFDAIVSAGGAAMLTLVDPFTTRFLVALARPRKETARRRRSEIMECTSEGPTTCKPWIIERPRCANGTTRIPRSPTAAIPFAR